MTGHTITITDDGASAVADAPPKLDLHGMYHAIDCSMVERVQCPWGEIWVDEEGLMNRKRINPLATRLAAQAHGRGMLLVGDAYVRVKKGYRLDPDAGSVIRE